MKKILMLILAAAMLTCVLSACGDNSQKFVILDENFGEEEYAIGFRKGENALAEKVQEILDGLYTDGTAKNIAVKWFGSDVILKGNDFASKGEANSPDDSLTYITGKGTFVLGFDKEYPPMGFVDDKTGEYTGFDIDLAKALCAKWGVELKLQPVDWETKELELSSKNIDCIWSGMSVRDDRKEIFTMSKPYLANAQVILVGKDSGITKKADLAGKKVGTQAGSAALDEINTDANKELKDSFAGLQEYSTFYEAYLDLQAGRIDAIIGDKTFLEYIIANQK
ncbi:MAG: transporter substrate-binding domain-containing protein [Oscillospiraceae bacterium]|nr:transporter substrate-binding domain-containing protein [Oscillospiraceae bacterium]